MTTILITGSTDGIGLAAAESLASLGHDVVLHGRNPDKADRAVEQVRAGARGEVASVVADLSELRGVAAFTDRVLSDHPDLGVVINNAGVFTTDREMTAEGLDVRFAVNTIAPYVIATRTLPHLPADGRLVNLSSAAQQPVDLGALGSGPGLGHQAAYAQSKLALTMWSIELGLASDGPTVIAVNPGSLLGTKMVQDGYGVAGGDIGIGADILTRSAVDPTMADANGQYFDNDIGRLAHPHPDALDPAKRRALIERIDEIVAGLTT
ncbi:MAG: SDR family NAD(P)-dependent oxidoreductase [Actinomycetota bacterium]